MESTAASKKPRQEKKSRPRRARRENRSLSGWCFKEKSRSRYDFTSGVPMFANGAATAAMVHMFNYLAHPDDVSNPKLDAGVCSQKGFECKAQPIQENLEKVASDKVVLGVQRPGNVSAAEMTADGLSLATPASATVRVEATVVEVSVDLYRVREVGTMIVTHDGKYYGSYDYHSELTGNYIEVANGAPYTRPAGVIEAPMTSFTSYPTRVNWSAHVGYQVPESNIQRRSW